MRGFHRHLLPVLFLACAAVYAEPTLEATTTTVENQVAEDFYRQALSAYLDGNYDKAIVLAAKSLEKDPGYKKSKSLLAILTAEKEQEGKTVIWLAGEPVIVTPTPVPPALGENFSPLRADVDALQDKMTRFMVYQKEKNFQTDGQISVIQDLVKNDNAAKYAELRENLKEINEKLEKIDTGRSLNLKLLYLLCAASIALSIWGFSRRMK